MNNKPQRVFLDTNVYIIDAAIPESDEAAILDWAGFNGSEVPEIEVVVSDALFRQVRTVARRLRDKDWAGAILMRIWRHMNVRFVIVSPQESTKLAKLGTIPPPLPASRRKSSWPSFYASCNQGFAKGGTGRDGAASTTPYGLPGPLPAGDCAAQLHACGLKRDEKCRDGPPGRLYFAYLKGRVLE